LNAPRGGLESRGDFKGKAARAEGKSKKAKGKKLRPRDGAAFVIERRRRPRWILSSLLPFAFLLLPYQVAA
jgi:hypothetical protein